MSMEEMTLEFCARLVGIPFTLDDYKVVVIEHHNKSVSHILNLIDIAHRKFGVIQGKKDKLLFRHVSKLEKILDELEAIEKSRNHTHAEIDTIMWRIWTVRDIVKKFMRKFDAQDRALIRKENKRLAREEEFKIEEKERKDKLRMIEEELLKYSKTQSP